VNDEPTTEVYTDEWTLRRRFAELGVLGRLESGSLRAVVMRRSTPLVQGLPPGTEAQIVYYFEGESRVAVVHQFVLPDGSIGASGLPDPKWLRDGNTILKYRPS
jgi:hypothetical protein